jgi:hypothetical protein
MQLHVGHRADSREDSTGSVVTGETGLAHTRTIVDNLGRRRQRVSRRVSLVPRCLADARILGARE